MFLLVLPVLLYGCFEEPDYSIVPEISFDDIRFVDNENGADSLVLSFGFTDGDGNIGLLESDIYAPFHSTNFVVDSRIPFTELPNDYGFGLMEGDYSFIRFDQDSLVYPLYTMVLKEDLHPQDRARLPSRVQGVITGIYSEEEIVLPDLACDTYTFVQDTTSGSTESDTLLIDPNPYRNNIILDFYRKRGGVYEKITNTFSASPCADVFNSRIPIFDFDNFDRPLVGVIDYPLISRGFRTIFLNDSIMIEMFVYDRTLNKSNVLRTPDFTLQGLGVN